MKILPVTHQKIYSFKAEDVVPGSSVYEGTPSKEIAPRKFQSGNMLMGLGTLAALGISGVVLYKNKNIRKELSNVREKLSSAEKSAEELKTKLKEAQEKIVKTEEKTNNITSGKKNKQKTGTDNSRIRNLEQGYESLENENRTLRRQLAYVQVVAENKVNYILEQTKRILIQHKILQKAKPVKPGKPIVIKPEPKKSFFQRIKESRLKRAREKERKNAIVIAEQRKFEPDNIDSGEAAGRVLNIGKPEPKKSLFQRIKESFHKRARKKEREDSAVTSEQKIERDNMDISESGEGFSDIVKPEPKKSFFQRIKESFHKRARKKEREDSAVTSEQKIERDNMDISESDEGISDIVKPKPKKSFFQRIKESFHKRAQKKEREDSAVTSEQKIKRDNMDISESDEGISDIVKPEPKKSFFQRIKESFHKRARKKEREDSAVTSEQKIERDNMDISESDEGISDIVKPKPKKSFFQRIKESFHKRAQKNFHKRSTRKRRKRRCRSIWTEN